MSESELISKDTMPHTAESLFCDLRELGVEEGSVVLAHVSLKSIGWVAGGAQALVLALLRAVGESGTLMMPTHSSSWTDPALWENPPVPSTWWPVIQEQLPAFDPQRTPSCRIGVTPELFRTWPGVERSLHPVGSFAAHGPLASELLTHHTLPHAFGENSPVQKLYQRGGQVLLMGVGHSSNTSLHLAEHRAEYPGKSWFTQSSAICVEGERRWVSFEELVMNGDDFEQIGAAFEAAIGYVQGRVGTAESSLLPQAELVDFAVAWMERHRDLSGAS